MKTLIIDNFDSFTYNLYQYLAELGADPEVHRNNELSIRDIAERGYTHIVISPGPGSPDNKKDFGICSDVIKKCAGTIPILGVCLGHQGIIHTLGGNIIRAPKPVHGKRSLIRIKNSHRLFRGLPSLIEAMRYHSLIGDRRTIPTELEIIAETEADHLVMAVAHKKLPLYGVQFHPESIGTPVGKQILKNFLNIGRSEMTEKKAGQLLDNMVSGKFSEEAMGEILNKMAARGETIEEIEGYAKAMRKHAVKLPFSKRQPLMDTCGTGGSGLPRMNVSTANAFVLAAGGVAIAKHGNKAASGRCGSFDLLEALGVTINLGPQEIVRAIDALGIGFIFAPLFHPAMKIIAPVRKNLKIRTIFNMLGPLTNPAKPQYHLLGASSPEIAEKLIMAMKKLDYTGAAVVSGEDGLDEITLTGKTTIFELKKGKIRHYEFSPEAVGIPRVKSFKSIAGGDRKKNAHLFLKLLRGKAPPALQNLLLINAAFGFLVRGKVKTVKAGLLRAKKIIASGAAYKKFLAYKQFSHASLS